MTPENLKDYKARYWSANEARIDILVEVFGQLYRDMTGARPSDRLLDSLRQALIGEPA